MTPEQSPRKQLHAVVQSAVLLSQPVSHGCKVFACDALRRGFESSQYEVVFRVILVPVTTLNIM